MRPTVVVALCCSLLAHHAVAQNVVMINNGNRAAPAPDKPRTVTVTFQMSQPAPTVTSSEDITKAVAATNQSLYDIVNRECGVLTAALKGDCRLTRLTVGGNFNDMNFNPLAFANRGNTSAVITANATATFEIDVEAPAAASPAAASPSPRQ